MKILRRLWIILLCIGLIPMVFLLPLWAILFVFTGKFFLGEYIVYVVEFEL